MMETTLVCWQVCKDLFLGHFTNPPTYYHPPIPDWRVMEKRSSKIDEDTKVISEELGTKMAI